MGAVHIDGCSAHCWVQCTLMGAVHIDVAVHIVVAVHIDGTVHIDGGSAH